MAVGARLQMPIELHRHLDRAVPHLLADVGDGRALGQKQRRKRVPEIVEAPAAQGSSSPRTSSIT